MNVVDRIQNWYRSRNLDLSQLPLDIQQHILSQSPELIKKGRQLNQDMRNRLSNEFFENICQQPITVNELKYSGSIFYLYQRSKGIFSNITELFFIKELDQEDNLVTESFKIVVHFDKLEKRYFVNIKYNDQLYQHEFLEPILATKRNGGLCLIDSISYFRVLYERLDCINRDPLFARNETKRVFNSIIVQYNTNQISDLLLLYQYLIGHLWAFQQPYRFNDFVIAVNDNNSEKIKYLKLFIHKISPIISDILDSFSLDPETKMVKFIIPDILQQTLTQL